VDECEPLHVGSFAFGEPERAVLKVGRCRLTLSNPVLKAPISKHLRLREICWTAFKFCFQIQLAPLHQGGTAVPAGRGRARRLHPRQTGRAVQVDPIRPVLKAPETVLFKLRCDGPLSNVAFKFNLRRYRLVLDEGKEVDSAGLGKVCLPRHTTRFFYPN